MGIGVSYLYCAHFSIQTHNSFTLLPPLEWFRFTSFLFQAKEWSLGKIENMIRYNMNSNAWKFRRSRWRFVERVDPKNRKRKHFMMCVPREVTSAVWDMYLDDYYPEKSPWRSIKMKQEMGGPYDRDYLQ